MRRISIILFFVISFSIRSEAQENWYERDEDTFVADTNRLSFGVNLGAYFADPNTAVLYTGSPRVSQFGVEFVMQQQFNRQFFEDYFQHPYDVVEYPLEPRYQTAFELGGHLGFRFLPRFNLFADFNVVQLDFEQAFTVAIQDPFNGIPGPTFEQIPIIGEENRFFLNLGLQYDYYVGNFSEAYIAAFGHANNVQMQQNYFVVDGREFNIFHFNPNTSNQRPGGNGLGFGFGTGFKFQFYEHVWVDLMYQLVNSEVVLTETVTEHGLHHSLGIRIIWK